MILDTCQGRGCAFGFVVDRTALPLRFCYTVSDGLLSGFSFLKILSRVSVCDKVYDDLSSQSEEWFLAGACYIQLSICLSFWAARSLPGMRGINASSVTMIRLPFI